MYMTIRNTIRWKTNRTTLNEDKEMLLLKMNEVTKLILIVGNLDLRISDLIYKLLIVQDLKKGDLWLNQAAYSQAWGAFVFFLSLIITGRRPLWIEEIAQKEKGPFCTWYKIETAGDPESF